MRVLSLIPAFLLAVTSFVAAAPTSTPSTPACVPSTGGDDSSLQPIISIIVNATAVIQGFSDELSGQGSTPDANTVDGIVINIKAVVSDTVAQLDAQAQVDLSGVDLTNLGVAVYGLLSLVLCVLNTLVGLVVALAGKVVGSLQSDICDLLNAVLDLVGCLKIFVSGALYLLLGAIIPAICSVVQLLLDIVLKLDISAVTSS